MNAGETATQTHGAAVERRAFLWALLAAAVGALVGEWRGPRWKSAAPHEMLRVEGAANLRPGDILEFQLPGSDIPGVLRRIDHSMFMAFDRRCTHLGCPVLWDAQREQLFCPCHRGVFDAHTGMPIAGPPRAPLRRLAVVRRGDEVWVESTTEGNT